MATLDIIVKPKLKFSLKKCGEVVPYGITPEEKAKLAGIEENANNYTHPETHPASILDVVDAVNGAANKFLNERGEMVAVAHDKLTDKNSEAAFQHIDTTATKLALDAADMVAVKDSATGKMVLTPKNNFGADNLIFEYIHSSNKEVIIESIDFATNTFTATNHGLTNGRFVTPILNANAGNVYPFDVLVTGCKGMEYQIANKTDNTFQLYEGFTTKIVTLTDSATKDLTKWHFEVLVPGSGIDITNLNIERDFVVEFNVKTLGSFFCLTYINENLLQVFKTGLGSENISYSSFPHIDLIGGAVHFGYMKSVFSIRNGLAHCNNKYMLNKTGTTTGRISVLANEQNAISTLNLINYPITRIRINNMAMANGFTIKIYYK